MNELLTYASVNPLTQQVGVTDNLFAIASAHGAPAATLAGWLEQRTAVAAIGPVCAQALVEHGLTVRVQPGRPKMVPFVTALCAHVAGRRRDAGGLPASRA